MSGYIGAALSVQILTYDDQSHVEIEPWLDRTFPIEAIAPVRGPFRDALDGEMFDFRSDWWPAGTGLVADGGISDVMTGYGAFDPYPVSGCNGRLLFNGITRDQHGSPLANCTVRCYRTSTHELQDVVTSDVNGAYRLTTPYSDAHFLTVHGSSVAGASIDTVTAT